jgi:dihydroorotase
VTASGAAIRVKGGRVIDPMSGTDRVTDLVVDAAGVRLDDDSPTTSEVDASGCWVVPGLVDAHLHCYYGVTSICVDPRVDLLPAGVTACADGGTSGVANFFAFNEFVVPSTPISAYAWLNITGPGLVGTAYQRHPRLSLAEPEKTARLARRFPKVVVGVKALLPGAGHDVDETLQLLDAAVSAAGEAGLPVMAHWDGGAPFEEVVARLRAGDVITHAFQANAPAIADEGGLHPAAQRGREHGILFDLAPAGYHHFGWEVLEAAVADGFWPDVLSSDMATTPRDAPEGFMRSLPGVMSLMLHLGMPEADVVAAATSTPSRAIGRGQVHGTWGANRPADVTVLRPVDRGEVVPDMIGVVRTVERWLDPVATIKSGQLLWETRP